MTKPTSIARKSAVSANGLTVTFYWKEGHIEKTELRLGNAKTSGTAREKAWLRAFLKGSFPKDMPLRWEQLTNFQRRTLRTLCSVSMGKTITYGELARRVGLAKSGAARAVGQVMRRNPFAPFVPCHRVVAADGLGGYGGEMHSRLKKHLLAMEAETRG
jgi:methylated-DNA-[protein]-cysteine S-methyltransferase